MKKTNDLYKVVAAGNENVTVKDVKNVFVWYDLFAFSLSFQLLFIISHIFNWRYSVTMFSAIFIILVDAIIKELLDRDTKNYKRLKSELPLVKLWVIPLVAMAIVTTATLIYVKLFI